VYYWTIRSVLKEKPHLRRYLIRCRHCQILFFTHPRNEGRRDLRCPFGCRQTHRKQNAIHRSNEYYRSPEGKIKKKYLNSRRNASSVSVSSSDETPIDSCQCDVDTVVHIQLTTSLIRGRPVGFQEVIRMIERILRQHSIDKQKIMPYGGAVTYTKPP
jgi:hypothetical protein